MGALCGLFAVFAFFSMPCWPFRNQQWPFRAPPSHFLSTQSCAYLLTGPCMSDFQFQSYPHNITVVLNIGCWSMVLGEIQMPPSLLMQLRRKKVMMEQQQQHPTPPPMKKGDPPPQVADAASTTTASAAHDGGAPNTDSSNNKDEEASSGGNVVKKQHFILQTPSQFNYAAPPPQDSALRDFAHLATTPGLTPGAFIFGSQTPHHHAHGLTPGTASASGILKPSTYGEGSSDTALASAAEDASGAAESAMAAAGLSAMGLVRGDNTLQPTPVVRRGEQQQRHSVNLFQPGMHYYPGMVPQSEMKSAAELKARNNAFFRANDSTALSYDLRPGQESKVSNEAEDEEDGKASATSSQPMLSEFPFVFDGYAGWVCRHCSHLAYYYRGPNYVWKNPQPPPNYFVDHHLVFCPGLNPAIASNIEAIQRQSQSAQKMTPEAKLTTASELKRQVDPPTGRSPQPPSAAYAKKQPYGDDLPMLPNTATKDQEIWSHQWSSYQQAPSQLMPPGLSPPGVSTYPHFMQQTSGFKRKSSQKISEQASLNDEEAGTMMPKKVRRPYQHKSPAAIPSNDEKYNEAFRLLSARADAIPKAAQSTSDIGTSLVEAEDCELLTDYFYYMMMQLVVCRFSERDKKTRGGKRDNVAIGYGGLQCIHCSTNDYSRKFYWSTVDRLANSFAEIPAHVLKCKSCPAEVRDALLVLKDRHSSQMSSRPRGSQKVFFRRVWRRLHSGDIDAAEKASPSSSPTSLITMSPKFLATSVVVESALKSPEMASGTAAQMLKASIAASSPDKERVLLALPQDKDWLSDMDCFVRNNVEIFSATENDLVIAKTDKKYPIKLGQVGLRCIHCAGSGMGARREAVMYPYSVSGIYESVRDFQKLHLDYCPHLLPELKGAMSKLTRGCSSLSSVLRRYYVQAARALGLFDSEDGGIRAGGTVIPMISSGFSTSELSRKRVSSPVVFDQAVSKRQKVTLTEEV